jgi:hypothetical protein
LPRRVPRDVAGWSMAGGPACRPARTLSMSRAARCARTADDRRPRLAAAARCARRVRTAPSYPTRERQRAGTQRGASDHTGPKRTTVAISHARSKRRCGMVDCLRTRVPSEIRSISMRPSLSLSRPRPRAEGFPLGKIHGPCTGLTGLASSELCGLLTSAREVCGSQQSGTSSDGWDRLMARAQLRACASRLLRQ